MNYRLNKFWARSTHENEDVVVIPLIIQDVISSIVIKHEALATGGVQTAHSLACIKKIEIVDGSDVLFSLDGYEAEALDWYNNGGKFRSNVNYAFSGWSIGRFIGLNFGRYLWDPEYAFDPKRFDNPQLRISLDVDAGGAAPTYNYLTCWANLFDEKVPALKGFLMAKEIKEYTIVNNTHEYTDMPMNYPYRGLFLRPFTIGTEPNQCISNVKLSEDQDKRIPIDCSPDDILDNFLGHLPPVEETYYYPIPLGTSNLFIAPSARVVATGAPWADVAIEQNLGFDEEGGGRLACWAATAPGNAQIRVSGYAPHCVYQIPFGMQDTPADWYDVRRLGHLRLDITGAAGAGTGFIFLQQERLY